MDAETQAVFDKAWNIVDFDSLAVGDGSSARRSLIAALQEHAKAHPFELPKKAGESPPLPELLRRVVSAAGKTAHFGVDGDGEQRLAHQELTEAIHAYFRAESPHLCPPEPIVGIDPGAQPTVLQLEKGDVCVMWVGPSMNSWAKDDLRRTWGVLFPGSPLCLVDGNSSPGIQILRPAKGGEDDE